MATTKENPMNDRLTGLIDMLESNNRARGTGVRCPVCNAGVGKFCLKAGVTVHRSASDITIHTERIALQNA